MKLVLKEAIYLPIDPPTATAQQKGLRVVNGHPQFYEKQNVKDAKKYLGMYLKKFAPKEPYTGALRMDVTFAFATKDSKKIEQEYRSTRPDIDNLYKGLADLLCDLGYFKDDAQIVNVMLRKLWVSPEDAHLSITISQYEEGEE